MKSVSVHIACAAALIGGPSVAQTALAFPEGARVVLSETNAASSYAVPNAPFDGQGVPSDQARGAVRREVLQIPGVEISPSILLSILEGQLSDLGFVTQFQCEARTCGGFDFRFAIEVAPEPDMHVNINDYAFLSARNPNGPTDLTLLVSQGGGTAFVQIIEVSPQGDASAGVVVSSQNTLAQPQDTSLAERLTTQSRSPLDGVQFASGSTELTNDDLRSLTELAAFLSDNPELEVVLVGHTDADGDLDQNIALSTARARSVREILIARYGVDESRIDAQGVGYLLPLAPNATQAGRDVNRRVEVVVLN